MTPKAVRADPALAQESAPESSWPMRLTGSVTCLVIDGLAWGIGLLVAGSSSTGPEWAGLECFAAMAATTHLALGQASGAHRIVIGRAICDVAVATLTATGFGLAVSPHLPMNLRGCLMAAAMAAVLALGPRLALQSVSRVHSARALSPEPRCRFADTLDCQWLPQLDLRPGLFEADHRLGRAKHNSAAA